MNPMVDGWRGDDWFHNGAFRQQNMSYIYEQDGTRDNSAKWWISNFDDYDMFMNAGSAGELGKRRGPRTDWFSGARVVAHPSYDEFLAGPGRRQVARRRNPSPFQLCSSIAFGTQRISMARWQSIKAIKPKDTNNDKVFPRSWTMAPTARASKTEAL